MKYLVAKLRSLRKVNFLLTIQFVLILPFHKAVLYGNVVLSIVALATKTAYSSFLKKVLVFQKTCYKFKVFKKFKISSDCHIKHADLLSWYSLESLTHWSFSLTGVFKWVLLLVFDLKPQ